MNTSIVSVIYFIIAAMFGALGQYLYKAGAESSSGTLFSYLTNLKLIGGVLCYITVKQSCILCIYETYFKY